MSLNIKFTVGNEEKVCLFQTQNSTRAREAAQRYSNWRPKLTYLVIAHWDDQLNIDSGWRDGKEIGEEEIERFCFEHRKDLAKTKFMENYKKYLHFQNELDALQKRVMRENDELMVSMDT